MKFLFLATLLLFSFWTGKSQYYWPIAWETQPKIHTIPVEFGGESAVFVLDRRHIELRPGTPSNSTYRTVHRIIKVLDDKGLESFNKVSIAFSEQKDIVKMQARTILPNGKVIEVTKDKIKLTKTEEGLQAYVFAMEGIEKGAEVEYLFTIKGGMSMFGTETLQYIIPTVKGDFTLVAPQHYKYEIEGYNGLPKPVDTILDLKHFCNISASNIPGSAEEQYSAYEAGLMKVDYRLSYIDRDKPHVRLNTWQDLARQLYFGFSSYSEKEERIIRKYLKSIGVDEEPNEAEKIKKIEETLKSTINISGDITDASYLNFDKIIDKKLTTEDAFIRFFVACLHIAGIDYEVGLTSNRYEHPIDEKFENWKLLNIYLIYLPNQKKYLAPSSIFQRMPFIPMAALENKGIFCKENLATEILSQSADIRTIPAAPVESSNSDIEAVISFNQDMDVNVDLTNSFNGYSALGLRESLIYVPKEKEKELIQELVNVASKPEDIVNYKVENTAFVNYYNNKPLKIISTVNSPQLIEKAGAKYLLKVGDVIGRQVEMYQEKERKLPIEIQYPHSMHRTIIINVPQGYRIANPEVVKMMIDHRSTEGKQTMAFISDYELEANKMTIRINEFYNQVRYSLKEIEPFKKVINAAADFNKSVLVLEKI